MIEMTPEYKKKVMAHEDLFKRASAETLEKICDFYGKMMTLESFGYAVKVARIAEDFRHEYEDVVFNWYKPRYYDYLMRFPTESEVLEDLKSWFTAVQDWEFYRIVFETLNLLALSEITVELLEHISRNGLASPPKLEL